MNLRKMTPLQQRFTMSVIGVTLALIVIFLSPVPTFKPLFSATIATVIGVAMWEYYVIAQNKKIKPAKSLGITLGILYVIAVTLSTQYISLKELPDITLLVSLLSCFLYYFVKGASPFTNLSTTFFGIVYLAVPLSCMVRIAYFFQQSGSQDGRWWLLYLLVVTKMTDTGAFFFGKKFGQNKLAPYISPGKTWEGAIGGLCAAIAASIFIQVLANAIDSKGFELDIWKAMSLGLWIGLLAQCGDLAESLLKRDGGVQDSSSLPGLGGVLDIVDSLVFTAPVVYIFLKVYAI